MFSRVADPRRDHRRVSPEQADDDFDGPCAVDLRPRHSLRRKVTLRITLIISLSWDSLAHHRGREGMQSGAGPKTGMSKKRQHGTSFGAVMLCPAVPYATGAELWRHLPVR